MSNDKENRERIAKITRDSVPESNLIVARTLLAFAAVCFAMFVVFELGIIKSKGFFVDITLIIMPIMFIISSVWCILRKGKGVAFQYVFLVMLAIFWLELELMSGYKCKLLLPVLIVLSLRYYNRKFTVFTFFVCVIAMLGSIFCNAYLYDVTGFIDLNLVSFEESFNEVLHITYDANLNGFIHKSIIDLRPSSIMLLKNGLLISFLPNMIFLSFITLLTIGFMRYNLGNIIKAEVIATREADQRLELAEVKTKVMLSQVKPHFIYNTLSSIAMLCTREPSKAKELTLDFSDYLRNNLDTLDKGGVTLCSFEDELKHIKTYLAIECVRFGDRLNVEYDIKETDFCVPALSIQPIVENAVKHGICNKRGGGTVTISTDKSDEEYRITVKDDGAGFDREKALNDGNVHIGIENIEKRISLFGGTVTIESEIGVGTTVTVLLKETEGAK